VENQRIRVAIADDHPVLRIGIESALSEVPAIDIVGTCSSSTDLVALLDANGCDVLVTDFAMPGGEHGDGLQLLDFLGQRYPELAIVVITGIDRPAIVQAILSHGIEAIVSKADDMSHLRMAIQAAWVRRGYLSPAVASLLPNGKSSGSVQALSAREREVLSLFIGGTAIKDIAKQLQRSKQTVSTQKIRGMAKLGIEKDADLFKHALDLGLVPAPAGNEPPPADNPASGKRGAP